MFFKVKKITAFLLTIWLSIFSQLSVLHSGHAHDLFPLEQNMCDQNCEDATHFKAKDSCEWFSTQRLILDIGSSFQYLSQSILVFAYKIPNILDVFYSSPEHVIFSTRAPPIFFA